MTDTLREPSALKNVFIRVPVLSPVYIMGQFQTSNQHYNRHLPEVWTWFDCVEEKPGDLAVRSDSCSDCCLEAQVAEHPCSSCTDLPVVGSWMEVCVDCSPSTSEQSPHHTGNHNQDYKSNSDANDSQIFQIYNVHKQNHIIIECK